MERMEKRFTWTSVFLPDPNRPDSPRLVLRRVPVPAKSRSSSPESTTRSHPNTPLRSPFNSSYNCPATSSPNSFSTSSSSASLSASNSSSASSSSSSPASTSSSSSSSPSSPGMWTCLAQDDQISLILRKVLTSSCPLSVGATIPPCTTSTCTRPQTLTKPPLPPARPVPQWVRNLRAIMMERNRQCGIIKGFKRPADKPEGAPLEKRSSNN
ncbi:osteocalcin 2-like [Acanthopagrus latus]|uniref:osteocalcin 2-like n=1 Tax=Acanthopagrus latus TaxID=8177 RepID=UPI00187CC4AB|nr:osteocalcin 2-like [Acanthopagrus latus]